MPEWVAGQKFVLKDITVGTVTVNEQKTCMTITFAHDEVNRTVKVIGASSVTKMGTVEAGTVIPELAIEGKESEFRGETRVQFIGSLPFNGGGGGRGGGGGGRQFVPKSLGAEHGASICGLLKTKAEHGQSAADFWKSVGLYATCVLTLDQSGLQGLKDLAAKKVGEGEK